MKDFTAYMNMNMSTLINTAAKGIPTNTPINTSTNNKQ